MAAAGSVSQGAWGWVFKDRQGNQEGERDRNVLHSAWAEKDSTSTTNIRWGFFSSKDGLVVLGNAAGTRSR